MLNKAGSTWAKPELPPGNPEILAIYLLVTQSSILAQLIHQRLCEELLRRGGIRPQRPEEETRAKTEVSWRRERLIDFYFAYNLVLERLRQDLEEMVGDRTSRRDQVELTFNPELAPRDLLLAQLSEYEAFPEERRLQGLIQRLISDRIRFVRVAKARITPQDFRFIWAHHPGGGPDRRQGRRNAFGVEDPACLGARDCPAG